jgi:hypothetical protein
MRDVVKVLTKEKEKSMNNGVKSILCEVNEGYTYNNGVGSFKGENDWF